MTKKNEAGIEEILSFNPGDEALSKLCRKMSSSGIKSLSPKQIISYMKGSDKVFSLYLIFKNDLVCRKFLSYFFEKYELGNISDEGLSNRCERNLKDGISLSSLSSQSPMRSRMEEERAFYSPILYDEYMRIREDLSYEREDIFSLIKSTYVFSDGQTLVRHCCDFYNHLREVFSVSEAEMDKFLIEEFEKSSEEVEK